MISPTYIELIMGILSIIVFLYRSAYVMVPMLLDGLAKNNYSQIVKSFTLLV